MRTFFLPFTKLMLILLAGFFFAGQALSASPQTKAAKDFSWQRTNKQATPLRNGLPLQSVKGSLGSEKLFKIDVPPGATNLEVALSGGSGDVDLYIKSNRAPIPNWWVFDQLSNNTGNEERCLSLEPATGSMYIMLVGYSDYEGVTLTASYDHPASDCVSGQADGPTVIVAEEGRVDTQAYEGVIRLEGNVDADVFVDVCSQPQMGFVTFEPTPRQVNGGYEMRFRYFYNHFGPREIDRDTFTIYANQDGLVSTATVSLDLEIEPVAHPVQPACDNMDLDDDRDGIPDCAEQPGATFYGMPLYEWGARPGVRDIFVEIDYMATHPLIDYDYQPLLDNDGNPRRDHGTQPLRTSLDMVVESFAEQGIALHFDIGDLYDQSPGSDPADYDLGGGEELPFAMYIGESRFQFDRNGRQETVMGMEDDYVPNHFENRPERKNLFYYVVFGQSQAQNSLGSSGLAADFFDRWCFVSMGGSTWTLDTDTPDNTNFLINGHAATLAHELGHILGFQHGGNPEFGPQEGANQNWKPNYLSVMNYLYQFQGVPRDYDDISEMEMLLDRFQLQQGRWGNNDCAQDLTDRRPNNNSWGRLIKGVFGNPAEYNINYSHGNAPSYDENRIIEGFVFDGWDLNCDGRLSFLPQAFDLNNTGTFDLLEDHDDWGNMAFYYRSRNYQDGRFVLTPAPQVLNAESPAQAAGWQVLGQAKRKSETLVREWVPSAEFFRELHRMQNRDAQATPASYR